jgi:outer membrane protein assembly factor BamA
VNLESAPWLLFPFHGPFLDTEVYRFFKIDAEFARLIRYRKTSIALRFFGGIGVADMLNTMRNPVKENALPFFKQYFSGGPNSMRAWALRRLGPGSVIKNFAGDDGAPDRYGDVQLEGNAEYRFPLGRPFGIKVEGATFVDVGNVGFSKKKRGQLRPYSIQIFIKISP